MPGLNVPTSDTTMVTVAFLTSLGSCKCFGDGADYGETRHPVLPPFQLHIEGPCKSLRKCPNDPLLPGPASVAPNDLERCQTPSLYIGAWFVRKIGYGWGLVRPDNGRMALSCQANFVRFMKTRRPFKISCFTKRSDFKKDLGGYLQNFPQAEFVFHFPFKQAFGVYEPVCLIHRAFTLLQLQTCDGYSPDRKLRLASQHQSHESWRYGGGTSECHW
jgi:hypothetical protein